MAKIDRAGLILYNIQDNDIFMLFMKPSDPKFGGKEYQIPKGKVDEGETSLQAAIREASEEVGLFPPNLSYEPRLLGRFLGRTTIYVSKVEDVDMFGDPSTPEEVSSTKWMSVQEFLNEGRTLHRPIIKAAVRLIKKIEKLK